jgi:hypothetical protein
MTRKQWIALLAIILVGFIFPFIPTLVMIELFLLVIPIALGLCGALFFLLICAIKKSQRIRTALFAFLVISTFITSQLVYVAIVEKLQHFRGQSIILAMDEVKKQTGRYPLTYSTTWGLTYTPLEDGEEFCLSFSRGFPTTEVFDSRKGNWESFGWND